MEDMGFSFRLGAKTQEIMGTDLVQGVLLEGGEKLPAKMVIVSAGVRPNLELAGPLGLDHDKGIRVDEHMRTSQEGIYAAGDAVEFNSTVYGIWPAAMEQGKLAGMNMAGEDVVYRGTTMANTLKVVGIDLASAGNIDADGKFESKIVKGDKIYKKIVFDNNRIVGCIMLGDTAGFNNITQAMTRKKDMTKVKDQIFSEGFDLRKL
jgi:nitrite reductase (NADH) large subunit